MRGMSGELLGIPTALLSPEAWLALPLLEEDHISPAYCSHLDCAH